MVLTLVQLSASSVPVSSAVNPPKDGTTSPPPACIVAMSLPKLDDEIGMLVSPLQYMVHEPALPAAPWRNARVRYLLPDCEASPDRLSPVQVSKYGAKTCAGRGAPAAASATTTVAPRTLSRRDRRMGPASSLSGSLSVRKPS